MSEAVAIPKLSANEALALTAWNETEVGYGFGFRVVTKRTGLAEHLVRRTVRALSRKGVVRLERMLWNDEGPAGSGYVLTEMGRIALADAEGIPS